MAGDLDGLAALVTGGASGIGLAVSTELATRGARVVVVDRADSRPSELPDAVGFVTGDISDPESVRRAVARVVELLGGIDVLVNNAGVGSQGRVQDHTDDDWRRVLEVNVIGTARMCREAWPWLVRSPAAAVVNVSSIAATAGLPERVVYSASKGAVSAMTRAMAADGIADGVRVNAVNPGTADTPWVARLLTAAADPSAERAALEARQPHGRLVDAQEVAGAVAYLVSPSAGSTNGIELAVDGGMAGLRLRPRS